jgi:hypothetical protein
MVREMAKKHRLQASPANVNSVLLPGFCKGRGCLLPEVGAHNTTRAGELVLRSDSGTVDAEAFCHDFTRPLSGCNVGGQAHCPVRRFAGIRAPPTFIARI